ncbi:hypothetical protein DPMN_002680 [Dreissena polymorpha]|uniref:Uncharacterized protein n=1 Tax=Dreissena polymorpha TaxID=45954 RepID=A0A9D4MM41_DREPO|nr:hypothetical protein DPMN_002680 [Dreissena polymorpha]
MSFNWPPGKKSNNCLSTHLSIPLATTLITASNVVSSKSPLTGNNFFANKAPFCISVRSSVPHCLSVVRSFGFLQQSLRYFLKL